tara:strand:- start:11243 stop:11461 length:219 start_codon:yes stop_codon:yes gene_type:complete
MKYIPQVKMPTYNLAREVTYIEYYDDIEAESPEEAMELVREDMIFDHEEVIDAKAPEVLSWAEVIEHPNSPG